MLKALLLPMLCGCVLLTDGPVDAQQPKGGCKNVQTQADMNICAQNNFDMADKALNAQYQLTRKAAKARDGDNDDADQKGADEALVKGQRAWLVYRDAHCDSWAYQVHGGSLETEFGLECQEALTRKRTVELKELADGMRN